MFLEGGDPVLDAGTLIVPVEGEPGGSGQHRPGQQEELHPEHGHTWFFLDIYVYIYNMYNILI